MTKIVCSPDEIKSRLPVEIKSLLDQDRSGKIRLVDVRQPAEYEAGHLPGAQLIPLMDLESRTRDWDRDQPIIVYCYSGHRSLAAGLALCGQGFHELYHLTGGIYHWPYNIVTGKNHDPNIIGGAGLRDILVTALEMESGARSFYLKWGQKTTSPAVKRLFNRLAAFEEEHMKRLYRTASQLPDERPLLEFAQYAELASPLMEGGTKTSAALSRPDEEFSGETEVLEFSIEKEYLAYDLYKQAAAFLDNTAAKNLLHRLAQEERSHADTLLRWMPRLPGYGSSRQP
jgi:rhodanese-related sulfurtransferase/rubrerythrin